MTYIIAELGSNFKSLNDCLDAVIHAKACGANAIKFQLASEIELYGYKTGLDIDKHFIKPGWLPLLEDKCRTSWIDFMCSAFSVEGYAEVNKYVTRHKVASCENLHPGILRTLSYYSKPVIISLGSTQLAEARYISNQLAALDVTFLYCHVSYPCNETRLETIDYLRAKLGRDIGFSDHSVDYSTIPVEAVWAHKASVIEKHFNPFGYTDTPDAPHSINRDEFVTMVQRIRGASITKIKIEKDAILKYRRRIIAKTDIQQGDVLTEDNCGVYRSLIPDDKGLNPTLFYKILGEKSVHDFKQGEGIHF